MKKTNFVSKHKGWTTIIVLLLVAAIVYAVIYYRKQANATATYQTEVAARGTLTATIGATGNVRANQTAVLAWQTSGMVEAVNVVPGQAVAEGEILATLSKSSLAQNILLAQADLVAARRNLTELTSSRAAMYQAQLALYQAQDALDIAEARYDNAVNAYGKNSTSRAFLEIKTNLDLAQARVDDAQRAYDRVKDGPNADDIAAAQARVDAAEASLRSIQITAPFAGTVTDVSIMSGDQASPGTKSFRVDDLSRLLIDVQVSEVDINSIQVGQEVAVTFDAILGRNYHGQVSKVALAGNLTQGVVNFTVTVELTDADPEVKPGMTAAVTITIQELEDVLLVPNRAVRVVNNRRVVYILQDGQPVEVGITLGATSDLYSEVVGGDLKEGDEIILNPPTMFERGGGGGPFGN